MLHLSFAHVFIVYITFCELMDDLIECNFKAMEFTCQCSLHSVFGFFFQDTLVCAINSMPLSTIHD